VGWTHYRDQWLMEALANLSALMIMEEKAGSGARIAGALPAAIVGNQRRR